MVFLIIQHVQIATCSEFAPKREEPMTKTNNKVTTRTSPTTGKITHQARVRITGFPTLTKTFKEKSDAEHWIKTQEIALLEGTPILTKQKERYTFAVAIEEYEKYKGFRSNTEKYRLAIVKEDFGTLAIIHLTAKRLASYLKELEQREIPEPHNKKKPHPLYKQEKRTYTPSTIRKIYFSIKKIYEWHSGFRDYPVNNVFKVVSAPTDDGERDRRLEEGEEERIIEAFKTLYKNQEEMKTLFLVSLETAMRLGEQLKITWNEVDFTNRAIRIHKDKTKTKKYREVPMTSVCIKLLEEHKKKTKNKEDNRVFWQWQTSHALYQRFKIVLKNAKIEDYRWHDNRHEAISRIFERTTLRDIEIAKISGHTNMTTLARYANLRSHNLADQMW